MRRTTVLPLLILLVPPAAHAAARVEDQRALGEGAAYFRYVIEEPTRAVAHVVRVDRAQADLYFDVVVAQNALSQGCAPVSQLVREAEAAGRNVVAAVNAGYFASGCVPVGALGGAGSLWTETSKKWVKVGFTPDRRMLTSNTVRIQVELVFPGADPFQVGLNRPLARNQISLFSPAYGPNTGWLTTGIVATLEGLASLGPTTDATATIKDVREGPGRTEIAADGFVLAATGTMVQALRPRLRAGTAVRVVARINEPAWADAQCYVMGAGWILHQRRAYREEWMPRFSKEFRGPHPRTVVGAGDDHVYLVTVDGRQQGHSMGLSFEQLAAFMGEVLGCREAVNLDGGGSSVMVIGGERISCPSDNAAVPCAGIERAVSNALVLVRE